MNRMSNLQAIRTTALLTLVLVLGAGFCLFDGHHGDDVNQDLCAGMLAVALAAVLVGPRRHGWLLPTPALAHVVHLPHRLDRPPRPAS
jgi:hypothetical protein